MEQIHRKTSRSSAVTRRSLLRRLGASLLTAPFAGAIVGCLASQHKAAVEREPDAGAGGGRTNQPQADASSDTSKWASGGTAAMTGRYADPFAAGLGTACNLTCLAGLGPCYANTLTRKDISEGHDGLPLRLTFLLVNEACEPLPNATVDIWHCAPEGLYSGDDAAEQCTLGDASARAARWFRGMQPVDANGRVDFDTCFPGWYTHRAVHIHVTVRLGGVEYATTPLLFDDTLDDEIIATQPLYSARGPRDTRNTADFRLGGSIAEHLVQTKRMPDGALLAWKTLSIRSSPADAVCQAVGAPT
jgi:protocatechuate 3,4-dioxygenase beta subunit